MKTNNPAFVLGMYETGLGVARSLGRAGVRVRGFDFKRDIGFHSRYVRPSLCPHPLEQGDAFVSFLKEAAGRCSEKPVLFIAADAFLLAVSRFWEKLRDDFLANLPDREIVDAIADKYSQYQLAAAAGVNVPKTRLASTPEEGEAAAKGLEYPVFVKGREATAWKKALGGSIKGFSARNRGELLFVLSRLLEKKVDLIVQELIPGPDSNHCKFCGYVNGEGRLLLGFTLRKIRQNPVRFGVGSAVESIEDPELMRAGSRFFQGIGYRGVGSAEFKRDERDGTLKLIELNPRYWQQNSLATACGMNFPLTDYLDATGQKPGELKNFAAGIKWVNRYLDFDSFLKYRREGELDFASWRRSLKGPKVHSDFSRDDPLPALFGIGFGKKLFRIPGYLWRRMKKREVRT